MAPSAPQVSFTSNQLDEFSRASHDRNPLHVCDAYARRTPWGERVVFGTLAALACLARAGGRPDQRLNHLLLEFRAPVFGSVGYRLEIEEGPAKTQVGLRDGRRLLLSGTARFTTGEPPPARPRSRAGAPRDEPAALSLAHLHPGLTATGTWAPAWPHLDALVSLLGGTGPLAEGDVAMLMFLSYLVGMEVPGRQALFSRLALDLRGPVPTAEPFEFNAVVTATDERVGLATLDVQVTSGATQVASAGIRAFVRPEPVRPEPDRVRAVLPSSPCLEGRVGLVVGASRGFGAALALALASQGATVYASFNHGRAGAELLAMNAAAGPGRLLLAQGDATDPTWCAETRERLLADCGRLDFLICNAFPTPVPLALHPASTDRVVDYAARGLRTVAEPLAGFIGQLAATRGWAAVVSSSYVNTAPPEWPHYVAAKASCEALLRAVVNQHRAVSGLIVRPPPLLTDLTNTPLARRAAVPPEPLAAAVVRRLSGAPAPGSTVLIDDTPTPLDG